MKEIKRERTIEEVCGYEANDGRIFSSKEECEKYEKTARAVIFNAFKQLVVDKIFPECNIWEGYGYGGEEFNMAIIDIKNEEDLRAANMYFEEFKFCDQLNRDYIGKRILVNLGYNSEGDCSICPRTEEELIKNFKKDMAKFFHPKAKEGKKDADKREN